MSPSSYARYSIDHVWCIIAPFPISVSPHSGFLSPPCHPVNSNPCTEQVHIQVREMKDWVKRSSCWAWGVWARNMHRSVFWLLDVTSLCLSQLQCHMSFYIDLRNDLHRSSRSPTKFASGPTLECLLGLGKLGSM